MSHTRHKRMQDWLYAARICSSFKGEFTTSDFAVLWTAYSGETDKAAIRRCLENLTAIGLIAATKVSMNLYKYEWIGWPEPIETKG